MILFLILFCFGALFNPMLASSYNYQTMAQNGTMTQNSVQISSSNNNGTNFNGIFNNLSNYNDNNFNNPNNEYEKSEPSNQSIQDQFNGWATNLFDCLINQIGQMQYDMQNLQLKIDVLEKQNQPTTFKEFRSKLYEHLLENNFKEFKNLLRRVLVIAFPIAVFAAIYKVDFRNTKGEIKLLDLQLKEGIISKIDYQVSYNKIMKFDVDFQVFYKTLGSACFIMLYPIFVHENRIW